MTALRVLDIGGEVVEVHASSWGSPPGWTGMHTNMGTLWLLARGMWWRIGHKSATVAIAWLNECGTFRDVMGIVVSDWPLPMQENRDAWCDAETKRRAEGAAVLKGG